MSSPFHFSALTHPWLLTLLAGVLALLVAEVTAGRPGVWSISTGSVLGRMPSGARVALRHTPAILRALGLALLVVALARPVKGFQPRKDRASVVDIMLCIDVSGSMRAIDFARAGTSENRLDVTKDVVRDFIQSRKTRPRDRYGVDRIGLILFGSYAWTQCPLTLDYGILQYEIDQTHIDVDDPRSHRTAIGSAIGLAVSRLRKSEAQSKVVILLTDGQNNAGEIDPLTAAHIASEYGIRVYTIGAGQEGRVLMPRRHPLFGEQNVMVEIPIDEDALREIASVTGGRFYRATDVTSLTEAYEEINRLETTEIELDDYYEHEEGFMPWAIAGLAVSLAAVFTRRLWFEPIP